MQIKLTKKQERKFKSTWIDEYGRTNYYAFVQLRVSLPAWLWTQYGAPVSMNVLVSTNASHPSVEVEMIRHSVEGVMASFDNTRAPLGHPLTIDILYEDWVKEAVTLPEKLECFEAWANTIKSFWDDFIAYEGNQRSFCEYIRGQIDRCREGVGPPQAELVRCAESWIRVWNTLDELEKWLKIRVKKGYGAWEKSAD